MTLLVLQDLVKQYGPVRAVDRISLSVPRGSRTAIVGPSGSGKTTLLRLIAGFERPDAGTITLHGDALADGPDAVPAHKRGIGIVSQDGALFPHLSVAENIGFGIERGRDGGGVLREQLIAELLDMVELDRAMLTRRPHELSGGQQQRVALARALARKPQLMLLDEPFSALDTGLRETMRKAVARVLQTAGITAILVTHDQSEALSFADQVAVLRQGRLVQAGPPQRLYRQPHDRETAVFLGDAVLLSARMEGNFAQCVLGKIPVDPENLAGRAQTGLLEILLRPEQIRIILGDDASGAGAETQASGRVTELEFGGAFSTVVVELDETDAEPIVLRTSSLDLPHAGDRVRLAVTGTAHVFAP
ncbi:ABC transporter ATP-binding protein [Rhizobium sp. 0TCS1.26]|uniref:ABC transporter ATP-binding protein n=1 Tax=Rhizobium sp. 0TCS1.26 TaxID=3142623 RepID=UPI003D2D155F